MRPPGGRAAGLPAASTDHSPAPGGAARELGPAPLVGWHAICRARPRPGHLLSRQPGRASAPGAVRPAGTGCQQPGGPAWRLGHRLLLGIASGGTHAGMPCPGLPPSPGTRATLARSHLPSLELPALGNAPASTNPSCGAAVRADGKDRPSYATLRGRARSMGHLATGLGRAPGCPGVRAGRRAGPSGHCRPDGRPECGALLARGARGIDPAVCRSGPGGRESCLPRAAMPLRVSPRRRDCRLTGSPCEHQRGE